LPDQPDAITRYGWNIQVVAKLRTVGWQGLSTSGS
jgi:hypothetical protein